MSQTLSTEPGHLIVGNPFDLVRTSCAQAAKLGTRVKISESGKPEFCVSLQIQHVQAIWDGSMGENSDTLPYSHFQSSKAACNYAVIFALMQFGHGFRYELHQACGGHGASKTITTGVGNLCNKSLSASRLCSLHVSEITEAFGLPADSPDLDLLRHQIHSVLCETGRLLVKANKEDMFDFVIEVLSRPASQNAPAASLVREFANTFHAFCDCGVLSEGSVVWLLKKAQLAVGELQRILGPHDARFRFSDIDQMTAIIDNVVPAMLVKFGVLVLAPSLQSHIQARKMLPRGPEEAELRAVAIHACEQITERCGRKFNSAQLAYYLWKIGKDGENRKWERHLTKDTIYY